MFVVPENRRAVNVGDTFGRLTVIGVPFFEKQGRQSVVAKCECGRHALSPVQSLRRGTKRSCGCLNSELSRQRATTHGQSNTPLHKLWKAMKVRCLYPSHEHYKDYGGRGITIFAAWFDFAVFYQWAMANGYEPGLEIDRKDPNGNYEPGNCQFKTRKQQMQNLRNTLKVTAFGETKSLTEWSEDDRCVVGRTCFEKRIRSGWNPETALTREARV